MSELLARRTKTPRMRSVPVREVRRVVKSAITIQQPQVEQYSKWNATRVVAAIDAHEHGDFAQSSALADSFGRDDRISACMNTRTSALVGANGVDFTIEPAEGTGDELAKRVSAWWFDFLPDAVLRKILSDAIYLGVSISRIHWATVEGEWRPVRCEPWHGSLVSYNGETRRYVVQTDGDDLEIDPDDPNWLVLSPGGEKGFMCGAVRALGLVYIMRQFNWRDWARYNERHGLPIIAITEPSGTENDKTANNKKRGFYESVRNMGSTGMLRMPANSATGAAYKVDLIEAKDRAFETFVTFRRDTDIGIAVQMLGQNLSTESAGGSYALGKVQDRIRQDYLDADAQGTATDLRDQVIKRYCRYNVANFEDAQAPWPTWQTAVPVDRKEEAETANAGATAVKTLQSTGMPIDYALLLERLGLPVREGEDPNKAKPPPPPPVPGAAGEDEEDEDEDEAKPKKKAAKKALRLRSGARMSANPGFVAGQLYADELADESKQKGGKAQKSFVDLLYDAVADGADYEAIRSAVLALYRDAVPPERMREILQKTLVLARLAGQAAVLEDAKD